MVARDHIGQHLLVSVADVRRRIRVIDRRGDEKRLRHTVKLAERRAISKLRSCRRQLGRKFRAPSGLASPQPNTDLEAKIRSEYFLLPQPDVFDNRLL